MMAATLLDRWASHFDPVHFGWSPRGIATATCATNGWFFPRVRGGVHLRRAVGRTPTLDDPIVGAGAAGATVVREFPWIVHAVDTTYTYRLTAIGGGGVEEDGTESVADVSFGPEGAWVGARPNPVRNLRVRPRAGGRMELRWAYAEAGQDAPPAWFAVFTDDGSGVIDYGAPVATVPYQFGAREYRFVTDGYAHGTRLEWAVRAVTAEGVDDGGTETVTGWADSGGPAGPADVAIVAMRPRGTM
jgi:hypothetical protein